MFLKVIWNNKTKKISFPVELQSHEKFLEILKTITGHDVSTLEISFYDVENEKLPINDRLDFDYFIAANLDGKYREVFAEKKITESETSIAEKEVVMQESFKQLDIKLSNLSCQTDPSFVDKITESAQIPISNMYALNHENRTCNRMGMEDFAQLCVQFNSDLCINRVKSPPLPLVQVSQKEIPMTIVEPTAKIELEVVTSQPVKLEKPISVKTKLCENLEETLFKTKCPFFNERIEQKEQNSVKRIHHGITCDICSTRNIIGKRYKCLNCVNFDICETCESNDAHSQHPMVRVSETENEHILIKITKKYGKMKKRVEKVKKVTDKIKTLEEHLKPKHLKKLFKFGIDPTAANPVELVEIKTAKMEKEQLKKVEVGEINTQINDFKEQARNQKKDILIFMFGDSQIETINELLVQFENVGIEEMCVEIERNNQIIDRMYK